VSDLRQDEVDYDEFDALEGYAQWAGIPWTGRPPARRVSVDVAPGQRLSMLAWYGDDPEVVFVHGGGQNAHTWDTVALALGRSAAAIDLPGHGHSDWRDDHDYSPVTNAEAMAVAVRRLAPAARLVVGMSLGGLTAIPLAAQHPELVRRLAVVDVTPGADEAKAEPIIAFLSGPERFGSFDEILARTVQFNPTRSVSSLRRGVLHNAREGPDGSWTWRYDPVRAWKQEGAVRFTNLWDDVARIQVPMLLIRGALSGVVTDDDVAELRRRRPEVDVVTVEGAGHSIQGDKPVELAAILEGFLS
jgi:pimeloyl-ACP methyl ester carboxylesterase